MAHSRLRMSRKSWRKRQRDKDLARGTIWTILKRHFRPLRPVGAFCRNSKREKTLRRMICNRSAETRRRGSLMVREVGCSTNLALWKGLMAATSRTMVKWSASSTVREAPDSLCYWIACHPYAEPADGGQGAKGKSIATVLLKGAGYAAFARLGFFSIAITWRRSRAGTRSRCLHAVRTKGMQVSF
jgi:hypothetical protein